MRHTLRQKSDEFVRMLKRTTRTKIDDPALMSMVTRRINAIDIDLMKIQEALEEAKFK